MIRYFIEEPEWNYLIENPKVHINQFPPYHKSGDEDGIEYSRFYIPNDWQIVVYILPARFHVQQQYFFGLQRIVTLG